ncbi:Phosphomethylpyrimidine synthase [compost metagenome]
MCGPKFCSMRISHDIRQFSKENGLESEATIQEGMELKAKEFKEKGSVIYK